MEQKSTPYADLHMHTYYSDGRAAPGELLAQAAAQGLQCVAVTDHQHTRGNRESRTAAADLGLELVPAVEFSVRWEGYGWPETGGLTDVLAYFLDIDHPLIQALEGEMLTAHNAQIEAAVERLAGKGYPVSFEECRAIPPGHFVSIFEVVRVLSEKGYEDRPAVFQAFLDEWRQTRTESIPVSRVIEAVHAAGGVVMLAHPTVIKDERDGQRITSKDLGQLVEMGLDGIEIFHYRLPTVADRDYYREIAAPYGLLISGGSDEHGWPSGFPRLGREPITREMVEALRTKAAEWHHRAPATDKR